MLVPVSAIDVVEVVDIEKVDEKEEVVASSDGTPIVVLLSRNEVPPLSFEAEVDTVVDMGRVDEKEEAVSSLEPPIVLLLPVSEMLPGAVVDMEEEKEEVASSDEIPIVVLLSVSEVPSRSLDAEADAVVDWMPSVDESARDPVCDAVTSEEEGDEVIPFEFELIEEVDSSIEELEEMVVASKELWLSKSVDVTDVGLNMVSKDVVVVVVSSSIVIVPFLHELATEG